MGLRQPVTEISSGPEGEGGEAVGTTVSIIVDLDYFVCEHFWLSPSARSERVDISLDSS